MAETLEVLVKIKDSASAGVKKIGGAFAEAKKKALNFLSPANLIVASFTAMSAIILKNLSLLAGLETKMVNVGNLYGASRKEVNKLTGDLVELSRTIPQSVGDLADSLFDVVSAGVPAAESIEFLGAAANLATAGVTTTSIAVDGMTSVIKAFGFAASDATMISDKFFAAQQKGKTTIAELSSSIGQVAPLAAGLGVSFDELISTMSALTLSGIKTTHAANGLRAAYSNLIKPSEKAKKTADLLGIAFDANAVKTKKGFINVLKDVIEKTGGSKDALGRLFGSVEAVNVVLAASANEFRAFDEVLGATIDSTGKTAIATKELTNTLGAQWTIIKNNALAITKILLGWLIPATRLVLQAFNFMFDGIHTRIKMLKKSFNSVFGFIKKISLKIYQLSESTEKKTTRLKKEEAAQQTKILKDAEAKATKLKQEAAALQLENDQEAKALEIEAKLKFQDEKTKMDQDEAARQKEQWESFEISFKAHQNNLLQVGRNTLEEQLRFLEKYQREEKLSAQNSKKLALEVENIKVKAQLRIADSILDSAKIAADGEKNIVKSTTNFIKDQLKRQVGAFIAAEQAKLAAYAAANFWNPAGWLAAAQVVGLELIKNEAYSTIDRFQDGGIIRGSNMVGDRQTVRVNSEEMILNKSQQKNLANSLFMTANSKGSKSSDSLLKEIKLLRQELGKPKEIKLNGNSFSKATYQTQKRLLRNGQISTKG